MFFSPRGASDEHPTMGSNDHLEWQDQLNEDGFKFERTTYLQHSILEIYKRSDGAIFRLRLQPV